MDTQTTTPPRQHAEGGLPEATCSSLDDYGRLAFWLPLDATDDMPKHIPFHVSHIGSPATKMPYGVAEKYGDRYMAQEIIPMMIGGRASRFKTLKAAQKRADELNRFSQTNVKEHAPPLAGAHVDTGIEVHTTGDVDDKAASGGCCVSSCSAVLFFCNDARNPDIAPDIGRSISNFPKRFTNPGQALAR
jgi:hypothetical protein